MITKFKVFVSGNQNELKEERLAVREAILENAVLNKFFDVFIFEEVPAKGKSHGLKLPVLFQPGDFFKITFYGPRDKILDLVPNIPKERQMDLKGLGLNNRQIEALRIMVNEKKKISTQKYCKLFKVSRNTAYLDLKELVEKHMVSVEGKGRAGYYIAT